MNSNKTTFLIAGILAFALLTANVSAPVFATGGLDDEEEEEAIEELQNSIEELQNAIGTIELNLTQGANDITANCPPAGTEPEQNVTEPPIQNTTEPPTCPFLPPVENNVTEPIIPPTTVIPPVQNLTCPFLPPVVVEPNVTEPICNIPQDFIPGIVLPNVTEPVEPVQNVTEPEDIPLICPFTGLPIIGAEPIQQNNVTEPTVETPIQDEQEVATIEFEASCGCFVLDKTPEEVTELNGSGNGESVEQALSNLGN